MSCILEPHISTAVAIGAWSDNMPICPQECRPLLKGLVYSKGIVH